MISENLKQQDKGTGNSPVNAFNSNGVGKIEVTREESSAISPSQSNYLTKATGFGRSFIAMFNRFLEHTFDSIHAQPEEKMLWFTWKNESNGSKETKFFVDLEKNGEDFILEIGIPGDTRRMTLNFRVLPDKKFIFLRRRNYGDEPHCIKGSGLLWLFRVNDDSVTFASNPFRKAVDENSWILDFLKRIQNGNTKPVSVSLSLNTGLTNGWKESFRGAAKRLLNMEYEEDNSFWVGNQEADTEDNTESLIDRLEHQFQANDPVAHEMAMAFLVSLIFRWFTCAVDGEVEDAIPGFPKNEDMHHVRPVDLNPYGVNAELRKRGLSYPYQTIIAACSALNAGKHLILSGPPGNGKTELAIQLAKMAGVKIITATANPSWTAAEMMGRYMPKEKGGLEFVPGYFLTAIENSNDKKWLLIDEFNRADIDTCMGELFTILSNQAVVLPFRAHDDMETTDDSETETVMAKRIAVIPAATGEQDNTRGDSKDGVNGIEKRSRQFDTTLYKTYVVPPEFRIIATMNDSDASRLNPLSFALRRRFVILRVEAPEMEKRRDLIQKRLKKIVEIEKNAGNENSFYRVKSLQDTVVADRFKDIVQKLLYGLFASKDGKRQDLLDMRLIGVGQILDVIDFIKEGLRAPNAGDSSVENDKLDFSSSNEQGKISQLKIGERINQLIASYAALAVEMMVFPQLDACDDASFEAAVSLISGVFANYDFLVIDAPSNEQSGKQVDSYRVVNHEWYSTVNDYLINKLKSQYNYQPDRLDAVERIFGERAKHDILP